MSYEAVVFAGGGCRCFWQVGFWTALAPSLSSPPKVVTAVSAGAAGACTAFSERSATIVEHFVELTANNPRNAYWGNVLRRQPVFPHEDLYRGAIAHCIDENVLAGLKSGPEIRVLVGHPPARRGVPLALIAGLIAYRLDRVARRRLHVEWPKRLGFEASVARVQDCETPADLAELLLHSSCTPPVTRFHVRDGRPVVDGGIIDPAPTFMAEDAETHLVLLSRHSDRGALPRVAGRTYVHPSRPISVSTWDYSSPQGIRDAYDLGLADGERFARERKLKRAVSR